MTRRFFALLAACRRDRRGASAVEFSIVCIPLLLFMFGIMEFGRAIFIEEALQNTASKVARCMGLKVTADADVSNLGCASSGATSPDSTLTIAYARAAAHKWGLTTTLVGVTPLFAATTTCPGMAASAQSYVLVTITYPFSTVAAGLVPPLASKTITAQACYPLSASS